MLRFLTAGESHGPALTAILEGMPAGLPIGPVDLQSDMQRRQKSYGSGKRMSIEKDSVRITGGVMAGKTTGGPISLTVDNRDWPNWCDKEIDPMTIPRPGHADLAAAVKYGYRELRLALERASARETAARVAVGSVCRRFLSEFDISIGSYVISIGNIEVSLNIPAGPSASGIYRERFEAADTNDVRCPDSEVARAMRQAISEAMQAKDTLGGVFEVVALGVPIGLGSHVHWDRRLTSRLLAAVGGIQAVKGVEVGPAFEDARLPGSKVHDEIHIQPVHGTDPALEDIERFTNRAGGLEGGVSNGQPIVVRGAMKPIATTLTPLHSVDLGARQPAVTRYERSDFCAVPRAAVVAEAMVAFVLADALIEKMGGDSLDEMRPRFSSLRRCRLDDLPMDNLPWQFGYE